MGVSGEGTSRETLWGIKKDVIYQKRKKLSRSADCHGGKGGKGGENDFRTEEGRASKCFFPGGQDSPPKEKVLQRGKGPEEDRFFHQDKKQGNTTLIQGGHPFT